MGYGCANLDHIIHSVQGGPIECFDVEVADRRQGFDIIRYFGIDPGAENKCVVWAGGNSQIYCIFSMVMFSPHILYEDNHILVLVKPAGLLSQADRSGDPNLIDEMKTYLKTKYQKPGNAYVGLVQRLDRPVAGVMVLSKTSKAQSRLQAAISLGGFEKKYLMISHRHPPQEIAHLRHYLRKDEKINKTRVYDNPRDGAKECSLQYSLLADRNKKCLFEIRLHSGRSHQIRAQMAAIGCPVLGDTKYGGQPCPTQELALYAYSLAFEHPVGKEVMRFVQFPPPEEPWRGLQDFFPS